MKIDSTIRDLRFSIKEYKKFVPMGRVGLVPTMGALHEGHVSLIRESKKRCDFTAVSIFVNPIQFNNSADLENYPRSLQEDLTICEKEGVDLVFTPTEEEIFSSKRPLLVLSSPSLTKNLCGSFRPGHFEGVLYIVANLFNLFQPDFAFFGKKDYQQFRVIERMVRELNFPLQVVGVPTFREQDGLAMSSRNRRLDAASREQATLIHRALKIGEQRLKEGHRDLVELAAIIKDVIESGSLNRVEYVEAVDPLTLERLETLAEGASLLLAVAVYCSGIRLIDNIEVEL